MTEKHNRVLAEQIERPLECTRLDDLYVARYTTDGVALKQTITHFAGKKSTGAIREVNLKVGGMNQAFYINQVIALLEHNAVDWNRKSVTDGLQKLGSLLLDHAEQISA